MRDDKWCGARRPARMRYGSSSVCDKNVTNDTSRYHSVDRPFPRRPLIFNLYLNTGTYRYHVGVDNITTAAALASKRPSIEVMAVHRHEGEAWAGEGHRCRLYHKSLSRQQATTAVTTLHIDIESQQLTALLLPPFDQQHKVITTVQSRCSD